MCWTRGIAHTDSSAIQHTFLQAADDGGLLKQDFSTQKVYIIKQHMLKLQGLVVISRVVGNNWQPSILNSNLYSTLELYKWLYI